MSKVYIIVRFLQIFSLHSSLDPQVAFFLYLGVEKILSEFLFRDKNHGNCTAAGD